MPNARRANTAAQPTRHPVESVGNTRHIGIMRNRSFLIRPARSAADIEAVAQLFAVYAASLDVDLSYQSFATELATLPGSYVPPRGELLLARGVEELPLGCVALRPLTVAGCCEMKRLYVAPEARGLGLGRTLIARIITEAMRIGYLEMRLDTLPTMTDAIALYEGSGFHPIAAYYDTPVAGTRFLARSLEALSVPSIK